MCNIWSDFDRHNNSLSLHQELIAKATQTHSKPKKIYFLQSLSVALNFSFPSQLQWSTWPFLVEYPLDALEPQNKNGHIACYERKRMTLDFTGFAQLVTPGQVTDLKLTKITKYCLKGHIKTVLQLVTTEDNYVFSLANIMVVFTVIPIICTGQVRSKLVTNCNSKGKESRTLWQL